MKLVRSLALTFLCVTSTAQSQDLTTESLKGQRILVFSAAPDIDPVFDRSNPIWTSLEGEGVTLTFANKSLPTRKLNAFHQLWIFSSSRYDARLLSKWDFDAIVQYIRDGNGLYLLSDAVSEDVRLVVTPLRRDGLATFESNALASELFGARVEGNYAGMQVLKFPELSHSQDERSNRTARHPLLRGMLQLHEGTTISHITNSDKLVSVVAASDGKPLIAVPSTPELKVVIDCGYSRYNYTGQDFSDRVRLVINVANFLARKASPNETPVPRN